MRGLSEKTCLICGEIYQPESGCQKYCKGCRKIAQKERIKQWQRDNRDKRKEYYEKNKDELREYAKLRRRENKEKCAMADRRYREKHPERINKYREENKERLRQYCKEYKEHNKERLKQHNKEYRNQNKERIREYREENREQIRQYNREYQKDHPEKAREANMRRRAREKGNHHIPYKESEIMERDLGFCGICGESIPREWIEPRRIGRKVHIDHIIPISKGGADTLENVQFAHAECNISKGAGESDG